DDLLGMEIRRGEELDGVDAGIVEELVVVAVDARAQPPLPRPEGRAPLVDVAEGDYLAAWMLKIAGSVELTDVAATYDREADAIHECASASPSPRRRRPSPWRRRSGFAEARDRPLGSSPIRIGAGARRRAPRGERGRGARTARACCRAGRRCEARAGPATA